MSSHKRDSDIAKENAVRASELAASEITKAKEECEQRLKQLT